MGDPEGNSSFLPLYRVQDFEDLTNLKSGGYLISKPSESFRYVCQSFIEMGPGIAVGTSVTVADGVEAGVVDGSFTGLCQTV